LDKTNAILQIISFTSIHIIGFLYTLYTVHTVCNIAFPPKLALLEIIMESLQRTTMTGTAATPLLRTLTHNFDCVPTWAELIWQSICWLNHHPMSDLTDLSVLTMSAFISFLVTFLLLWWRIHPDLLEIENVGKMSGHNIAGMQTSLYFIIRPGAWKPKQKCLRT